MLQTKLFINEDLRKCFKLREFITRIFRYLIFSMLGHRLMNFNPEFLSQEEILDIIQGTCVKN